MVLPNVSLGHVEVAFFYAQFYDYTKSQRGKFDMGEKGSIFHEIVMIQFIQTGAEVGLLLIGYLGLRQVQEVVLQNKHARQTNTLNWFEKYQEFMEKADKRIHVNQKTYVRALIEMENFTFNEFHTLTGIAKDNFGLQYKYYSSNQDALMETTSLANKLEVISTALLQDAWDLDIIKNLLPVVHCEFVESEAYIYCKARNEAYMLYPNTIKLYKQLKPVIGTQATQLERVRKQIESIDTNRKGQLSSVSK